jgi:hypothetical protein
VEPHSIAKLKGLCVAAQSRDEGLSRLFRGIGQSPSSISNLAQATSHRIGTIQPVNLTRGSSKRASSEQERGHIPAFGRATSVLLNGPSPQCAKARESRDTVDCAGRKVSRQEDRKGMQGHKREVDRAATEPAPPQGGEHIRVVQPSLSTPTSLYPPQSCTHQNSSSIKMTLSGA